MPRAERWKYVVVNTITSTRILSALLVIALIARDNWGPAASLLLLGFASDLADGHLARKWGAVSKLGGQLDAQSDRLLLISPVTGMYLAGELPLILASTLVSGVWVADTLAGRFETMRIVWWPMLYALAAWGLWANSTPWVRVLYLTCATLSFIAVLIVKRDEVKRVLGRKASKH